MSETIFALRDLKVLLDQFKGEGLMVSCYADLSVDRGHQSRWQGVFKAKSDTLKKTLAADQRAWQSCLRDLEAIRQALESSKARHAQGMAVFSANQRGFFLAIPLAAPVENEIVVDQSPYLVPLLQVLHKQREFLVVQSDTHRGRLYAAALNSVRVLQEIEESVPKKQHSSGERWGKEQATIARHREDRILHYHKDLVRLIEETWSKQLFQGLILLGEHEVLEHIRKKLSARLTAQVIFEAPHRWTDKPLTTDETIRAILEDSARAQESKALEEVKNRIEQGYAVAAGAESVVDSLQNGRIGSHGHGYLIVGPDPRETVGRCNACRFLSTEMPAVCPRCQSTCVEANLWEELLLHALRHNIVVRIVKQNDELARQGGVVAVLA